MADFSFSSLDCKRILLIIGGSISAYKSLDLVRSLRAQGAEVQPVLTKAGGQFVTPLSVMMLCGKALPGDLFELDREQEINHIRLSRESDIILVAPASADLLARMALGLANDLATTLLLASDCPILAAPAMNTRMWQHPATKDHVKRLVEFGVSFIGPEVGLLAEGEEGIGRMAEPDSILSAVSRLISQKNGSLVGKRVIVTSGPTREMIDPIRYLSSGSSGKQGHAIARALSCYGADVTLVSGPVHIPAPPGVRVMHVVSAQEMLQAVKASWPADIFVSVAAVTDWYAEEPATGKLKKSCNALFHLKLTETPDILELVSKVIMPRPLLVIGFAAETEDLIVKAGEKLKRKGCDWIIANNVMPQYQVTGGIMGMDANQVSIITSEWVENWPLMSKCEVASGIAKRVAAFFECGEKTV
ncbi:MAG: bifunctional phosphopantothenoylcysteine decarboxylase/phosphopantothenate--cysteine ligase CoaBC [Alphaproteobacteria bacterium]|nr:bifunctional phosphopantothenoylcysteine decarboxylase/phosphopantothenate--cysteine ligase CoaBC [Alphaproteobacteria bacterium]